MKRVTASEARRNWFRLLDEIVAGQVVVVERKGWRIVLRREARPEGDALETPDYGGLIRAPDVEDADRWSWEWSDEEELRPADRTDSA
ncbi:MAG TPA: hypothetical protein VM778_11405 [Gemmatimonadota bacterium]|nr:hypothetical protein [Gemmatimonadota bacterium]